VSSCPVTITGFSSVEELFCAPWPGLAVVWLRAVWFEFTVAAVVEGSGVGAGVCAAAVNGSKAQPKMPSESATDKAWGRAKKILDRRKGCITKYK